MYKKKLLLVFLLLIPGISFSGLQSWYFQAKINEMTDELSCLMFSSTEYFVSTPGVIPIASYIYIGLQDSGNISLISKNLPFNTRLIDRTGVRIDKNAVIFGPTPTKNSHILNFNKNQSQIIIEQMLKGDNIKVQAAIFPDSNLVIKEFPIASRNSLSYFTSSLSAWKGCQYNKANKGWLGLITIESPCDEKCSAQIKNDYGFNSEKVVIVWASDPRKVSYTSGLKFGDSIISYDGKKAEQDKLILHFKKMKSGDTTKLIIMRGDNEMTINVTKP